MRTLVLTWEFPPYVVGGMGKHAAELTPKLGGLSTGDGPHAVDVLTTRYAGGESVEKLNPYVTVHRVETAPLDPFNLYNSVIDSNSALVEYGRKLAEQHKYDLLHVHDWLPGVAGVILKHEWKAPLIATIHATERGRHQGYLPENNSSPKIHSLEWQICHEAWRIIVCSKFMTTELNHYFQQPFDKIVVIPNGIDLDKLHHCSPEDRVALRNQYAPNGERLLFFVGRITHEKGAHVLIRAMPYILADHSNTQLLIGGKNSRDLRPLAHELGVDHAVQFLDFISDQTRDFLLQSVDAAIFPSLYEPFGIVALEAMALGCNVIASDVGGLGEVVQHTQNGLTVYPNDAKSIDWAVRQLFANPASARQRRERALYQVQHLYNWQGIAEQTVQLFEDVVKERRQTNW